MCIRDRPEGHLEVIAKCKLLSKADGMEVFSGPSCSCSSMEVKFRYRFAKRDVQTEQLPDKKEADRLKAAGLGKWIKNKFAKSGENPWEWFDRIENRDIADTRNNVRQMAHKRALVKVVRNFGAMSEIFTEDPTEWNFADNGDVPVSYTHLRRCFGHPSASKSMAFGWVATTSVYQLRFFVAWKRGYD